MLVSGYALELDLLPVAGLLKGLARLSDLLLGNDDGITISCKIRPAFSAGDDAFVFEDSGLSDGCLGGWIGGGNVGDENTIAGVCVSLGFV